EPSKYRTIYCEAALTACWFCAHKKNCVDILEPGNSVVISPTKLYVGFINQKKSYPGEFLSEPTHLYLKSLTEETSKSQIISPKIDPKQSRIHEVLWLNQFCE